jgi:hypothetical protein
MCRSANIPISRSDRQSTCAVRDRIPGGSHDPSNEEPDTAIHGDLPPWSMIYRRSPSLLEKRSRSNSLMPSCPSNPLIASTATPVVTQVDKKTMGTVKRERSRVGRKSEQRRTQNMFAQKKYRDKRLHAAELVSHH